MTEARVVDYCDFCGTKKEASTSCRLCGSLACGEHAVQIRWRGRAEDYYPSLHELYEMGLAEHDWRHGWLAQSWVCAGCFGEPVGKIVARLRELAAAETPTKDRDAPR